MSSILTDTLCTRCGLCCDGTLFADVRLGSYASTATELDVDVRVAGGMQQHKALTLSGHPASGGVESRWMASTTFS